MKGDKCRQEQPRAGQNGNHAGRQMKEDKGRQARPRAGQNGDHAGRQKTNEGRNSQEQARMEITKGDK